MGIKKLGRKLIGEILLEEGYVDPKDLEIALESQKSEGGLLGEILVKMGAVSEEDLVAGLSKQLGVPFIKLSNYNVNPGSVKLLPKEIAEKHGCFAFDHSEHEVSLAMVDPTSAVAFDAVQEIIGRTIQIFLAAKSEIRAAIETHYNEAAVRKEGSLL